jgi:DNA primase
MHGAFNPVEEIYNCWRCGGTADVSGVLQSLLHISFQDVRELIERYSTRSVVVRKLNRKIPGVQAVDLPGGPLTGVYRRYLRHRGFRPSEVAEHYGVRGGPVVGAWRYRLIIPIVFGGRIVSFQGRDVTGHSDIKYKTLEVEKSVVDAKSMLYGLDDVPGDTVAVVEGVMDAWRIGPGAAATFGVGMTDAQTRLLARRFRRVTFVFDPEPAAQRRAERYAADLASMGLTVNVLDTELDHDPGSMSTDEVRDLRRELGFPQIYLTNV